MRFLEVVKGIMLSITQPVKIIEKEAKSIEAGCSKCCKICFTTAVCVVPAKYSPKLKTVNTNVFPPPTKEKQLEAFLRRLAVLRELLLQKSVLKMNLGSTGRKMILLLILMNFSSGGRKSR